jgi:hypothetical protein
MEGLVYEKVWWDWGVASRGWKGRFWKEEVLCRPGYILGDDMLKDGSTRREEVRWFSFLFFFLVSLLVLSVEGPGVSFILLKLINS